MVSNTTAPTVGEGIASFSVLVIRGGINEPDVVLIIKLPVQVVSVEVTVMVGVLPQLKNSFCELLSLRMIISPAADPKANWSAAAAMAIRPSAAVLPIVEATKDPEAPDSAVIASLFARVTVNPPLMLRLVNVPNDVMLVCATVLKVPVSVVALKVAADTTPAVVMDNREVKLALFPCAA